jgi:hypothetical protein
MTEAEQIRARWRAEHQVDPDTIRAKREQAELLRQWRADLPRRPTAPLRRRREQGRE